MKTSAYNVWVDRGDVSYVYNGVSGAVLQVPTRQRAALTEYIQGSDEALAQLPGELIAKLAAGRMVVPDDTDELDLLRQRYDDSRRADDRFSLTIVPSYGCNFDCPYCFEDKFPSLLSSELEDALVDVTRRKLERASTFAVSWFGGEPLMGRASIERLSKRFIALAEERGATYHAGIITNGYLLDESTCEMLTASGVSFAQITLDGPPDVHDRMRPLVSGRGTFWQILENIKIAVNYFTVSIRVNIDADNAHRLEELLVILRAAGLSGRCTVDPGQLVGIDPGVPAPSVTYAPKCVSRREYAMMELEFEKLIAKHGFGRQDLPSPTGTPCTAVRANDLIVGSRGELYKCWETVGSPNEVVGHIRDILERGTRQEKWLTYDPFADAECRTCIALPVCMGGCANHSMQVDQFENRCGSFRHNYQQRVEAYVTAAHGPRATGPLIPAESLTTRLRTRGMAEAGS